MAAVAIEWRLTGRSHRYTRVRSSTRLPSAAEPSDKAMKAAKILIPKLAMVWVATSTVSSAALAVKASKMATPPSPAKTSNRAGLS